jgi:DNA-directed RNA polymerase specialized sigma24 family protein
MISDSVNHSEPKHTPDLRCRQGRRYTELVLQRAEHLPPGDRDLIRAVYALGRSVQEIARLSAAALGREPRPNECRLLRRRVRRLLARLEDPLFGFAAERCKVWPPTMRRVAELCVLGGQSQREAMAALGLSYHTVRRHWQAITDMARAEAPREQPLPRPRDIARLRRSRPANGAAA